MSFELLKNIQQFNREEEERGREEAQNPTECPDDAWPLKINSRGQKSCPFCERIFR